MLEEELQQHKYLSTYYYKTKEINTAINLRRTTIPITSTGETKTVLSKETRGSQEISTENNKQDLMPTHVFNVVKTILG